MGNGQDGLCTARNVVVEGKQAAWVFSEFQSDRSVEELSAWVEPQNWSRWGKQLFRSMQLLGTRTDVSTVDGEQWHGKYLEDVSLAGRELHTVLQCDVKKTDDWVAMTYDLDHSVGDVLNVDRGFLAAIDLGDKRLVKALKVVGFTDTVDNALATAVCPLWTDWILKATETAAKEADGSPVGATHGTIGDDDNRAEWGAGEAAAGFTRGYARQWADCVSSMANFYGDYATDVGTRVWSGDYGTKDAAEDSSRLFLRLARDWSRVWRASSVVAEGLADADVPPTGGVPSGSAWRRSAEYTTVLVPVPDKTVTVTVSGARRIGKPKATIPAKAFGVDPARIPGQSRRKGAPGLLGVRVHTDTTDAPAGLYEGELIIHAPGSQDSRAPLLFYVSKCRPLNEKE